MKTETLRIKVTYTEPVLGSCSGNPEVHAEFIASRIEQDKGPRRENKASTVPEEVAAVQPHSEEELAERIEKTSTVFARDDKGLFLFDYMMRGFVKETLRTFIDLGQCKVSKWSYKRVVDSTLFVFPRRLYLHAPSGEVWQKAEKNVQRPLRAETMRGERVALANSEMLPAGTWFDCELRLLEPAKGAKGTDYLLNMELVRECLDYGQLKGLGQWRSGSWGRIEWAERK